MQDDVEADFLVNISQNVSVVDDDEAQDSDGDDLTLPWYMISNKKLSMILWELIFSLVVMFNMITVPLMITFPWVIEELSTNILVFELCFEGIWVLQIILKFVTAEPPIIKTFTEAASNYFFPMFILDLLATAPSIGLLVTGRRNMAKYFMLIRFSHWQQFFFPVQLYFEKFSKVGKAKRRRYMNLAQVFVGVLILGHVCACGWIIIGKQDETGGTTWLYANDFPDVRGNESFIFWFSYYWIFEVFTTVGYGDYSGGTNLEWWYSIFLEFFGVAFNSILIGVMSGVFDDNSGYESLLSAKMDEL